MLVIVGDIRHKFKCPVRNRSVQKETVVSSKDTPKSVRPDGSTGETDMFDIFSGISDRHALWVEAVVGIRQARARVEQIAELEPGDYFIFHAHSGGILARVPAKLKRDEKDKPWSGTALTTFSADKQFNVSRRKDRRPKSPARSA
jgi:hypothetical protein